MPIRLVVSCVRSSAILLKPRVSEILEHWTETFIAHYLFKSLNFFRTTLYAVASLVPSSCANLRNDFDGFYSIESEMSNNFSSLNLDGLPHRSASDTKPVSWNLSISLRTTLRWGQLFLWIFQQIAPALNRCIYCLLEEVFNKKNIFLNSKNHNE
jgi:hypothetical protein